MSEKNHLDMGEEGAEDVSQGSSFEKYESEANQRESARMKKKLDDMIESLDSFFIKSREADVQNIGTTENAIEQNSKELAELEVDLVAAQERGDALTIRGLKGLISAKKKLLAADERLLKQMKNHLRIKDGWDKRDVL